MYQKIPDISPVQECVFFNRSIPSFNYFMATSTKITSEKKLWIGNLDKRLTEYVLITAKHLLEGFSLMETICQ